MRTNAAKPSSSTNHRGDRRNCLKSHILAFTSIVIVTYHCLGAQLAISVHNCPVLADTRFPMSIFKRTQRKYVKKAYRVRNWREYESGVVSKNTNELKTGSPGRFGIDVSTLDWPMGARIIGHEHTGPALDLVGRRHRWLAPA